MTDKIKLEYVMKKITIDKDNISKFILDIKNRRNLHEAKIKSLVEGLLKGEHFNSPFVINDILDRWKLLDANHRIEALKRMFKINPNFEIEIWVAVYKDLSPEDERKVFKKWNVGSPQSSNDFLKCYFETIPLGKELLKKLPVSIYGSKTTIPIKSLVGNQIVAKSYKKFSSYSTSKDDVVEDFKRLNLDDIDLLIDFISFMTKCFGKYEKGSQYYQTTPISAFYRIWFDNRNIDESKIIKLFQRIFVTNANRWKQMTQAGGRTASQSFYRVSLDVLNNSTRIHFKNDDEALSERKKEIELLTQIIPLKK